jgi:hypothetical protein
MSPGFSKPDSGPYAGGNPNNGSNAGLGCRNGNNSRSNTNMNIVFRALRSLQNPDGQVPRAAKRTFSLAGANFRSGRRFKGASLPPFLQK